MYLLWEGNSAFRVIFKCAVEIRQLIVVDQSALWKLLHLLNTKEEEEEKKNNIVDLLDDSWSERFRNSNYFTRDQKKTVFSLSLSPVSNYWPSLGCSRSWVSVAASEGAWLTTEWDWWGRRPRGRRSIGRASQWELRTEKKVSSH